MNLHIVPDNVFTDKFYKNLVELGIQGNNKIVVRTNHAILRSVTHPLDFARLYSPSFDDYVGDTRRYDKVFIHQFSPLLYRWVAEHEFRELNWMVWGADLYNLPSVRTPLYEKLTARKYVDRNFSWPELLYRAKVLFLHARHRKAAYGKVKNLLTWMQSEYEFARRHVDGLTAAHQFFFYENQMPYQALNQLLDGPVQGPHGGRPRYVLGNSSTPELNHLDAVAWMEQQGIEADLYVPVSYGDARYARFLKKQLARYKGGEIHFVDRFMEFKEYFQFLRDKDGVIMNNIRPQGYGNILMMMYLGKKVFLNPKNLSIQELNAGGLQWFKLTDLNSAGNGQVADNRRAVEGMLSHEVLVRVYRELFS